MLDFHNYKERHGEHWVQTIIEQIERLEGRTSTLPLSLEERWNRLMPENADSNSLVA